MTAELDMLAPREHPIAIPSEYELAQMVLEPLRALVRDYYVPQVGLHYTTQAIQALLQELAELRQGCSSLRSTL